MNYKLLIIDFILNVLSHIFRFSFLQSHFRITSNEILIFRMLESNKNTGLLDINCCDPLGRTALLMAIDNENLEIIDMLLENKVIFVVKFKSMFLPD